MTMVVMVIIMMMVTMAIIGDNDDEDGFYSAESVDNGDNDVILNEEEKLSRSRLRPHCW